MRLGTPFTRMYFWTLRAGGSFRAGPVVPVPLGSAPVAGGLKSTRRLTGPMLRSIFAETWEWAFADPGCRRTSSRSAEARGDLAIARR